MDILESLYYIYAPKIGRPEGEYQTLKAQYFAARAQLTVGMSDDAQKNLIYFEDILGQMDALNEQAFFVFGFRLGAQIMLSAMDGHARKAGVDDLVKQG